jgi:hypothetical protein
LFTDYKARLSALLQQSTVCWYSQLPGWPRSLVNIYQNDPFPTAPSWMANAAWESFTRMEMPALCVKNWDSTIQKRFSHLWPTKIS